MPDFLRFPKFFFTCVREVEVGARRRIFFMSSALAGRRVGGWFGGGSNMEEKKRREKRDRMRIEKSSKTTRNQKRGFFNFLARLLFVKNGEKSVCCIFAWTTNKFAQDFQDLFKRNERKRRKEKGKRRRRRASLGCVAASIRRNSNNTKFLAPTIYTCLPTTTTPCFASFLRLVKKRRGRERLENERKQFALSDFFSFPPSFFFFIQFARTAAPPPPPSLSSPPTSVPQNSNNSFLNKWCARKKTRQKKEEQERTRKESNNVLRSFRGRGKGVGGGKREKKCADTQQKKKN